MFKSSKKIPLFLLFSLCSSLSLWSQMAENLVVQAIRPTKKEIEVDPNLEYFSTVLDGILASFFDRNIFAITADTTLSESKLSLAKQRGFILARSQGFKHVLLITPNYAGIEVNLFSASSQEIEYKESYAWLNKAELDLTRVRNSYREVGEKIVEELAAYLKRI